MGAEIGLLVLCLFLFFWRLGDVPLFDYDEALYVTCAQQMVVSGDWITPRLNTRMPERPGVTQVAFFEKPIMVYWAAASSMRLFGRTMWAARLPVALIALLTTFTIYLAGRKWFGRRAGLFAALTYASAPMTLVDARQMTTDGLLILWLTIALLCFWQIMQGKGKREKNAIFFPACFWLMCALAVLTKGVVGLLLPFMIISVYLLLDRVLLRLHLHTPRGPRIRFTLGVRPLRVLWSGLARLRPVSGLLLFLLVAAPWHILIARGTDLDAQSRTWVQEYLLRQHVGRFKGLDTVHNQPIITYFAYFLIGFFPWACFAPAAFRARFTPQTEDENQQTDFLLVWFWTIFVFFSIGAAKLPTYITPAYPAAALLVGRWLDRALRHGRSQEDCEEKSEKRLESGRADEWERMGVSLRRGAAFAGGFGLLLLLVGLFAPMRTPANVYIPPGLVRLVLHISLLFAIGSGAAWACFRDRGKEGRGRTWGVGALILMMALVIGVGCTEGYAATRDAILDPYQQLAAAARPDVQAGIPALFFNVVPRRPSMLFYAGYAPFEHKETPLLPFLGHCLTPTQREMNIITTGNSFTRLLVPEISALPGATVRLLQKRGPADGWVMARVYIPASYVPPPLPKIKHNLWTPVTY